jgi:hypothetical protein
MFVVKRGRTYECSDCGELSQDKYRESLWWERNMRDKTFAYYAMAEDVVHLMRLTFKEFMETQKNDPYVTGLKYKRETYQLTLITPDGKMNLKCIFSEDRELFKHLIETQKGRFVQCVTIEEFLGRRY